jgi:D-alanyl-D-alanine carboxypeptidase
LGASGRCWYGLLVDAQAIAAAPAVDRRWHARFVLAIATFVVSLVLFLAIVVTAACGSGSGGQPASPFGSLSIATTVATDTPTSTPETPAPTQPAATPTPTGQPGGAAAQGGGGDRSADLDDTPLVACHDTLAPVDKQHRLAADCVPAGLVKLPDELSNEPAYLRSDAAADLERMLADARAQGLSLYVASSYRSYDNQVSLFQYWVQTVGLREAERSSARPGHSEHQLGTTVDLTTEAVGYEPNEAFARTPEGIWVGQNSWKYGFIVSYPAGSEDITGYEYEPWHIRWVGLIVAGQVHASGLTLGEYLLHR